MILCWSSQKNLSSSPWGKIHDQRHHRLFLLKDPAAIPRDFIKQGKDPNLTGNSSVQEAHERREREEKVPLLFGRRMLGLFWFGY